MKHTKSMALLCALTLTVPFAIQGEASLQEKDTPATTSESVALLRGLELTLPALQNAVESGTFKNISPEAPKPILPEPEPLPMPEPIATEEEIPLEEDSPMEETMEPVAPPKPAFTQGTTTGLMDQDGTYNDVIYNTTKDDDTALRISMAYITADNAMLTKTGHTTDVSSSESTGLNAALLVTHGSRATMKNTQISSSGLGATGAFAFGKSTYLKLEESTITTTANHAPGLVVSERAMLKSVDSTVTTSGDHSTALRIHKNGILMADGGTYTTKGMGSHGLYSEGNITVTKATVRAENTKAAVIKGNHTITLKDSVLEGQEAMDGEPHNVVLMSDSSSIGTMGTQQFEMENGSLISHRGDMFYITSTHGVIKLKNVHITMNDDNYLFRITGNDGVNGWGTPGTNGGHVRVIADSQSLQGTILVDSISDINLSLQNGSIFTGTIHIVPNEDDGTPYNTNADLFISADSVWNLTEDAQISSLFNLGTIHYNGHTITLADGTVMHE